MGGVGALIPSGDNDGGNGTETVGALLARLRRSAGLSQRELGDAAGSSASVVSRIESGKTSRPHAGTLRELAKQLRLDESATRELLLAPPGGVDAVAPWDAGEAPAGSGDAAARARPGSLAQLLRNHRLGARLEPAQLARRAGVSRRTIDAIEAGQRTSISLRTAMRLADGLRMDDEHREMFAALGTGLSASSLTVPGHATLHGRRADYGRVTAALRASRLVTITGPGGVGKTALADVVARQLPAALTLPLAAVPPGTSLIAAVAALTQQDLPPAGDEASLLRGIGRRSGLLVLDNLEHVTGSREVIGRLLEECAELKVLVTSRTKTGVPGETLIGLDPLDLAPAVALLRDRLREAGVAQSTVARAVAAAPANGPAGLLEGICQRLDRLPLAIEMVPQWLASTALEDLPGALDDPERHLVAADTDDPAASGDRSGAAGGPSASLADSVRRSLEPLSDEARRVFAAMSVAAAPWTLELLQAAARSGGQRQGRVLQAVRELSRSGLARPQVSGTTTFLTMLQTVRDVGLAEAGRLPDRGLGFRERHAAHVLALATQHAPMLNGPNAMQAGEKLDAIAMHVRPAVEFCLGRADPTALKIVAAMWRYWLARGQYRLGIDLLRRVRAAFTDLDPADDAASSYGVAVLAHCAAENDEAARDARHALSVYRALPDPRGIGGAISLLGMISFYDGRVDEARRWYAGGLAEITWEVAPEANVTLLTNYAPVLWAAGDKDGATALALDAADRYELLGDTRNLAVVHGNLAKWAISAGDLGDGRQWLNLAKESFNRLNDQAGRAGVHLALADLALMAGDVQQASAELKQADELTVAKDDPWQRALGTALAAELALLTGDLAEAQGGAEAAERAAEQLPYAVAIVRARAVRAFALAIGGHPVRALPVARAAIELCPGPELPTLAGLAAVIAAIALRLTPADPRAAELRSAVTRLTSRLPHLPTAAAARALAALEPVPRAESPAQTGPHPDASAETVKHIALTVADATGR